MPHDYRDDEGIITVSLADLKVQAELCSLMVGQLANEAATVDADYMEGVTRLLEALIEHHKKYPRRRDIRIFFKER